MKKSLTLTAAVLISACSTGPNLYSPVLPMMNGINQTTTIASTKSKAVTQATRNAERYCKYNSFKGYVIKVIDTQYSGLIDHEPTADKIEATERIVGFGPFSLPTGSEYTTSLEFICK